MQLAGTVLCACALLLLPGATARGNDSAAGLDGGNLVLTRSTGIEMQRETLTISPTRVEVRYVFRNTTPKDIETLVAFPLPDEDLEEEGDRNYDPGSPDPLGFELLVDGTPRSYETKRKRRGEIVERAYYWTQRFPARASIVIEHRYRPVATRSMGIEEAHFCIDDTTARALSRISDKGDWFRACEQIGYVLKTARNWKGPIGDFRLIVDKESPSRIVSFCFPGPVKKVGPTSFEARRTKFVPQQDLDLLFCSPR